MPKFLKPSEVETRLLAIRKEDQAEHLSHAFLLARAIREEASSNDAPLPDLAWLTAFLPRITDWEGLLVQSQAVADVIDEWGNRADSPNIGAVLIFDDLSFLRFTEEALLHEDEGEVRDLTLAIDEGFPNYEIMEVLGATPAFLARHPDLEAWKAELPDEVDEDLIAAITEVIREDIDPSTDGIDMSPSQSWESSDETRIEELMIDAWLGLGIDEPCEISIFSALEEGGEMRIELESHPKKFDTHLITERLTRILQTVIGLHGFVGHEWEYNDGAHDRLSGFSQFPQTIAYIDFEPAADFSNHHLIEARPKLVDRLVAAGMDKAEAETLVRLDLEAA